MDGIVEHQTISFIEMYLFCSQKKTFNMGLFQGRICDWQPRETNGDCPQTFCSAGKLGEICKQEDGGLREEDTVNMLLMEKQQ